MGSEWKMLKALVERGHAVQIQPPKHGSPAYLIVDTYTTYVCSTLSESLTKACADFVKPKAKGPEAI